MIRNLAATGLITAVVASCECSTNEGAALEHVARVNGEPISMKVFEAEVKRNLDRHHKQGKAITPNIEYGVQLTVLDRLIDEKTVELRVRELRIDPNDSALNEKFIAYKKRFPSTQALNQYLERSNSTAEMVKANIRRDLLVEHLGGPFEASGPEAQAHYKTHQDDYKDGDTVRPFVEVEKQIRHLLTTRERDAKARSILQQIKQAARIEKLLTISPPTPAKVNP